MSNTIPASFTVDIVPGVVGAGGTGLVLQGLMVTQNTRVPIGIVQPFASAPSVIAYFGAGSAEAAATSIYFTGPDNSQIKPGSVLFAQYPQTAVPAFLRGGSISGLTLAQLQAVSGTLSVTVDGVARAAASINLSGAASFSAAAGLIQTGLNASPTQQAAVTASVAAAAACSFTGSIAGNILTVTAMTAGTIVPGATISGTSVTASTLIRNQLSGTTGGVGTYCVSASQTVASTTITATSGTMTVTAVASGSLTAGQTLSGTNVTAGTQISQQLTGTAGGIGTYTVTSNAVVASTAVAANPTSVAVTYDSTSGGFLVTSGVYGAASTIGFATGTISSALNLTQANAAVISQGSAGLTPAAFMNNIYNNVTQNWATFMTVTDPDSGSGNAQKLLFAQWNNGNNQETAYVCWDTDASPTAVVPASTSLGALLASSAITGTVLIWGVDNTKAAFACGFAASVDFTQFNGRATAAFRSQAGLAADVTSLTVANNLILNGYNYYGANGTANDSFIYLYPGSVSGQFLWFDSYIDQIWLNNALQLSIMSLLVGVRSIPYNNAGYALIDAACADPISQALNAGVIRAGVPLSALQIAEVNNAAGKPIDKTLSSRGWYLLISPATAQVRAQRGSPPCTLWYMDGQSVQKVILNSLEVQ